MSSPEDLPSYVIRQAATVGRKPKIRGKAIPLPRLPNARGRCLGTLGVPCEENICDYGRGVVMLPGGDRVVGGGLHGELRCWDLATGELLWESRYDTGPATDQKITIDIAYSADGEHLATAHEDGSICIWRVSSGEHLRVLGKNRERTINLAWSPDGRLLASVSNDGTVRLWTPESVTLVHHNINLMAGLSWSPDGRQLAYGGPWARHWHLYDVIERKEVGHFQEVANWVFTVSFSPDGALIAAGVFNSPYTIGIWDLASRSRVLECRGHSNIVYCVLWSPDGRLLASGSYDNTLRIWEASTGREVDRFEVDKPPQWSRSGPFVLRLSWSPDGRFIASNGMDDVVRLWDVSHLAARSAGEPLRFDNVDTQPLPGELRLLPLALARLLRLGIHPPLSLLRDLLAAVGGRADGACEPLRSDLHPLAELHWPAEARVGLVALLLHAIPQLNWRPPSGTTPNEVRNAVARALAGAEIPPEVPPPPIALLRQAAERIDERLLSLLALLGPEAVAAEPALPLRLLPKVGAMPRLNRRQRQLLGVRARVDGHAGKSMGIAAGMDRVVAGGIEMGPLNARRRALLPTQLAMPPKVQLARHLRAELLFRSREAAEPPRLRPTVIVLDVSPPTFGPVESVTRLAAHIVASTLRDAGVPVVLVMPEEPADVIVAIEQRADLVEVWTRRTLSPANAVRLLRAAGAVRSSLRDGNETEPAVLLLSHCWFGAEERLPEVPGLRGLFVRHPGHDIFPAAASLCERHQRLSAAGSRDLGRVLGELLA